MEIGGVPISSQLPQTTGTSGSSEKDSLIAAAFKKTENVQQMTAEQSISTIAETTVVKDPNEPVGQNLDVFA
ncbi:MAG: hypothetical protein ABW168_23665 [Sedimenticola sp.]